MGDTQTTVELLAEVRRTLDCHTGTCNGPDGYAALDTLTARLEALEAEHKAARTFGYANVNAMTSRVAAEMGFWEAHDHAERVMSE